MTGTLWTIGYGATDLDGLVRCLVEAGVRRVVDVRELPASRKPGFSKLPLQRALHDAGIDFVHLRPLGAPPGLRHADLPWDAYAQGYLEHLAGQEDALWTLTAYATERPTAILCAEADWNACHRSLIAQRFAARGWGIEHLAPQPSRRRAGSPA